MNNEYFITTKDNPFNIFTQFDDWRKFDEVRGYYTLGLVARTLQTSDQLSKEDQDLDFDYAIDKIIEWHGDLYKKVYKNESI